MFEKLIETYSETPNPKQIKIWNRNTIDLVSSFYQKIPNVLYQNPVVLYMTNSARTNSYALGKLVNDKRGLRLRYLAQTNDGNISDYEVTFSQGNHFIITFVRCKADICLLADEVLDKKFVSSEYYLVFDTSGKYQTSKGCHLEHLYCYPNKIYSIIPVKDLVNKLDYVKNF